MAELISYTRGIKPSTTNYENYKKIKDKDICYLCKKEFRKILLETEHEIPVCLGSSVLEFKPCCIKCHKEKTKVDIIIINFFKKIGFLLKTRINEYETPIGIKQLQKIYLDIYKIKGGLTPNQDNQDNHVNPSK